MKLFFPLYKWASLLLFLFFVSPVQSQVLYYAKGTDITVGENTTIYVANLGEIRQADLKDFEEKTSEKKGIPKFRKQKKSAFNSKKTIASHSAEKTKAYPKVKPVQFAIPQPDDFFLLHSKGQAISASVTVHEYANYFIENKRLRLPPEYPNFINNKIISNSFIVFKDYYWFQYKNRPPPSSFI